MKLKIIRTTLWTALSLILVCGCTIQNDGVAVSSDGVKISYEEQGKGSRALVFVHGWSSNRESWDAQVAYFSKEYKWLTIYL